MVVERRGSLPVLERESPRTIRVASLVSHFSRVITLFNFKSYIQMSRATFTAAAPTRSSVMSSTPFRFAVIGASTRVNTRATRRYRTLSKNIVCTAVPSQPSKSNGSGVSKLRQLFTPFSDPAASKKMLALATGRT